MSRFTKILLIGLAVIVVAFVLRNVYQTKTSVSTSSDIKIGSILPLSGDLGALGEEIRRGAELAVQELNAQGQNIVYVSEDDAYDPKRMVTGVNKLVTIDKIDAAFTAIVEEAKPTAPIFNSHKIPLLVAWDSNEALKTAGEYIFSIGFSTEHAGEKMAEYAYQKLGVRRVAILQHINEWADVIAPAFEKKFLAFGGQVILKEKVQPTEKDFRILILKVKEAKVDGLYFPMVPPVKGPFLIQAKQLGLNTALMNGDALILDEIKEAGEAAEGVYFTNIYAEETDALMKNYQAKYKTDPYDSVYVSFGYDAIRVLAQASKIAQTRQIPLSEALKQIDMRGTGSRIRMNGSRFSEREERIYKVVNGQPIEVLR